MERMLTALAAGLWVAPLLALAVAFLYFRISPPTGGSDSTIAAGYMMLLLSTIGGIAGFAAAFLSVRAFVLPQHLRTVQVVDAAASPGSSSGPSFAWSSSAKHPAPTYERHQALLNVEVRVPKDMLPGGTAGDMAVFFANGDASERRLEDKVREEGEFIIQPYEMSVSKLHDWSTAVLIDNRRYFFPLKMPDNPQGNVPWSEWTHAVARKEVGDHRTGLPSAAVGC